MPREKLSNEDLNILTYHLRRLEGITRSHCFTLQQQLDSQQPNPTFSREALSSLLDQHRENLREVEKFLYLFNNPELTAVELVYE